MSVNDIREQKNEDEAKYQGSKNEKIRKCHLKEQIWKEKWAFENENENLKEKRKKEESLKKS